MDKLVSSAAQARAAITSSSDRTVTVRKLCLVMNLLVPGTLTLRLMLVMICRGRWVCCEARAAASVRLTTSLALPLMLISRRALLMYQNAIIGSRFGMVTVSRWRAVQWITEMNAWPKPAPFKRLDLPISLLDTNWRLVRMVDHNTYFIWRWLTTKVL